MDREAWQAIVHGVTKSQTQLSTHACKTSSHLHPCYLTPPTHPCSPPRQCHWISHLQMSSIQLYRRGFFIKLQTHTAESYVSLSHLNTSALMRWRCLKYSTCKTQKLSVSTLSCSPYNLHHLKQCLQSPSGFPGQTPWNPPEPLAFSWTSCPFHQQSVSVGSSHPDLTTNHLPQCPHNLLAIHHLLPGSLPQPPKQLFALSLEPLQPAPPPGTRLHHSCA